MIVGGFLIDKLLVGWMVRLSGFTMSGSNIPHSKVGLCFVMLYGVRGLPYAPIAAAIGAVITHETKNKNHRHDGTRHGQSGDDR